MPVHVDLCAQGCHADTVTCLACHHDNVIVATGSTDGMAKLVNTVSGKVRFILFILRHHCEVTG